MEKEATKKHCIKLPWMEIKFSCTPDANLEMLPARYTVQYTLEEIFLLLERTLNHLIDEEPLVFALTLLIIIINKS
jgi:hypothetical protein